MARPKTNKSYELVDGPTDIFVRVKRGPFKGILYQYLTVSFDESSLTLRFTYDIVKNPNGIETENNAAWTQTAGDILTNIIDQNPMERGLDETYGTTHSPPLAPE